MIKKTIQLMCVILPVMLLAELFGGVLSPSAWYKADASDHSDAGTTPALDNVTAHQDINEQAATIADYCVSGCNSNTFGNSSDPNTIEYDNVVSGVTTMVKTNNSVFTIWGQAATSAGNTYYAPTAIASPNFSYTGTPLKLTAGSFVDYSSPGFVYYHAQNALLTTDGLYVWGSPNRLVSSSIKSGATFGKITVNGKTDGLPAGVTPLNVKMMFGSHQTLAIVTCTGEAWVLSFVGSKNGDGTPQNATNNVIWHRVKTAAAGNPNLENVVAVRGNALALFALTSEGKLYTWGTGTYLGDGSAVQNRTYATEVTVPSGVTPKMIGMTMGTATSQPYYLLANDGRLFAMGENTNKQLGDGTTADQTTWVQPQKMTDQYGQGTGPLVNIAWISPNEHTADNNTSPRAGINVLTNNKKLWGWGIGRLIGGASFSTYYDPIYMPGISANANGMKLTDEIIAVETAGDYALNYKKNSDKFGFVGYSVYNKGDGSTTIQSVPVYAYDTAALMACGADTAPPVQDIQVCEGTTTGNLNNANLAPVPSQVEWHATDDVNSPVMTNITAVGEGTYYAFYTVASGKPRTVSSAVTVTGVDCCSTGDCNPNSFVNSVDPNTIEYDAMVSAYHSTIVKEADGTFKIWGQETAPNGTAHLYSPTPITSANSFNYLGTPLKATAGSGGAMINHQYALLTTDGLYVWGTPNILISSSIKNTAAFGKITVNGKTDGLPPNVLPGQVKMMFGSYGTLAIVTCNGEAWVLSMTGAKNGDGTTQNSGTPNSNTVWHRVKTSAAGNPNLDKVVAMRGTANALFALTSEGKLYTWGTGTYDNIAAATTRTYATPVGVPNGVTPKMIGMTEAVTAQSYYLLATDGKLYTMGSNSNRQLGDGSTTTRNAWVQPQKPAAQGQGTGALENVVWISPNEHARYPTSTAAINVLTNNNKQWAWGINSEYMLGGATYDVSYDPMYMPGNSVAANGMKVTDEIIAVETGGHTSINVKKGNNKFGYVGHRIYGSLGDGSNADGTAYTYTYNTGTVDICGAETNLKEGYIYITKKALDENSSVDFNFTVNGGLVTAFQLNDKETTTAIRDLGSSQNGRLWAIASNNTLYYKNQGSSDWVQTSVTTAVRVDGATGNDCYFTNTSGQVLRFDGTAAPTVIGSAANFSSSNAVDVGSAWNTTPYIITANQTVWMYSGSGTTWTQVGTTANNTIAIDADPSIGDAIVTDGTIVYRLTSAGVKTSLGTPGYVEDIAVTSAGEIFSSYATGFVRKWNTGTTWHATETTSRYLADRMTGGAKDQVWSTNTSYAQLNNIYTRVLSGTTATWLDDERVRTTNKGNAIMIKVPVGTYTIKETVTSGWELQSMDVYDPTSNSSANYSDKSVTLNVAEGETVHAVFTNGGVTPFTMGIDCSTVFFEDFGSGNVGSFGSPLTGQTSYHYSDGSVDPTQDGYYTVVGNTTDFAWWSTPSTFDHTSNDGTGRMMAINASYEKGIFFRRKFTNLVPGKSYKFSAWLMSLSDGSVNPNATFQVVDPVSGTVLNQIASGDITTNHVWNEYSMDFVPTSTELDLILLNNAPGGEGNDIALDDIRFEMGRPENLTATRDCSANTVTITSPIGAAYQYSLDNINWQASPSFTGVSSTVNDFYVRYADTTACVSSNTLPTCHCAKPGATGTALTSSVGILTKGQASVTGWPETVPNGYLVLDGAFKGMVITHMTTAQINALTPVEGMLVFDTNESCVKLYRGTSPTVEPGKTGWVCIERICIDPTN